MERRASASLWQACPDTVLQRRVAMEVAGLAVWGGAQRRTKLTDEQVPLPLSTLALALPLELGAIGLSHRHYNCRHFSHMKIRTIILSLILLLPFVPSMAQEQDDEQFMICYETTKPRFNGGDANEFSKWVDKHKRYPEEAKKSGIEGRVTTHFTITKEGKLTKVRILRGIHSLLDQEAVRVIESAPQLWEPGKNHKGETEEMSLVFPVVFMLSDEERAQVDSVRSIPFDYGIKERKPSFNGGDANEFSKWVHEHKIYPEEAKKAGIEGRVYTQFTITKEGKLTNLKLLRGVHPLLDQEAIRVIESAPQIWKPGLNYKGEPIDVNYTFPVLFSLPKE